MKTLSDKELLTLFEHQAISNDDWSHEFHIRIAAIYLLTNDFEAALEKIKSGIRKLNAVNHVPESQFRGFHETLTIGWLQLVSTKLNSSQTDSSLSFLEACPELLNSRLLNDYYSRDRLMSLEAKAGFIEPDLKLLTK